MYIKYYRSFSMLRVPGITTPLESLISCTRTTSYLFSIYTMHIHDNQSQSLCPTRKPWTENHTPFQCWAWTTKHITHLTKWLSTWYDFTMLRSNPQQLVYTYRYHYFIVASTYRQSLRMMQPRNIYNNLCSLDTTYLNNIIHDILLSVFRSSKRLDVKCSYSQISLWYTHQSQQTQKAIGDRCTLTHFVTGKLITE